MAPRSVVVGAGRMGAWHARYATRAGARVVAVVDLDLGRARALARGFPGAQPFGELGAALRGAPADVVHVCAGRDAHALLAETALAAGMHVLVEKPAATSARAAARLVELARKAGRLLCPVHQFPFQAGFERVLRQRQRLGHVVRVAHVVASAGGLDRAENERRALLVDLAPHALSLFRALLGPDCDGAAWQCSRRSADDLDLAAQCGDASLVASFSLRARPTRNELSVTGTAGTARVDLFHGFATFETGRPSRAFKLLFPFRSGAGLLARASGNLLARALRREPAFPGLLTLVRRFYAALDLGRGAPIGEAELLASAALVERLQAGSG